jgi:hypothetical protein
MKDSKKPDDGLLSSNGTPNVSNYNKLEEDETIFNPLLFENICKRLDKLPANAQPLWGQMNCTQMLNHLKISTGSGMAVYRLKDESSFLYRTIIKFILLRILWHLPKNAAAPKGFSIEMNYNLDFDTEKSMTLAILKMAKESNFQKYPHPLFGKMSKTLWGRLVYRHFDHHLRQFGS